MLWGQPQSNIPSRFLDDLPTECTEKRSDDVLSAFAWASKAGHDHIKNGTLKPFSQRSGGGIDIEFNQDTEFSSDGFSQEARNDDMFVEGAKVRHPSFGNGTITSRRGDIVDVKFRGGESKTFALSIAPLQPL